MAGLSPKLPLRRGVTDGFTLNKTMAQVIRQNLKNLVLTSPGERMMLPNFGVGLRNFLFEQGSEEVYNEIENRLLQQVSLYMPFLQIEDISFLQYDQERTLATRGTSSGVSNNILYDEASGHALDVSIAYSVPGANILDLLNIPVDLA